MVWRGGWRVVESPRNNLREVLTGSYTPSFVHFCIFSNWSHLTFYKVQTKSKTIFLAIYLQRMLINRILSYFLHCNFFDRALRLTFTGDVVAKCKKNCLVYHKAFNLQLLNIFSDLIQFSYVYIRHEQLCQVCLAWIRCWKQTRLDKLLCMYINVRQRYFTI